MPMGSIASLSGMLADTAPPDKDDQDRTGTSDKAAREDHTHVAKVQRASKVLDANGEAVWTFTRPFTQLPIITSMFEESANNQPIVLKVKARSTTSVTVRGYRGQTLPLNLTLLTALIGFNIFGGTAPTGVTVHLFAAEPTP